MRRALPCLLLLGVVLLSLAAAELEDQERRLGPFTIAGQSFTIVLHEKRLPAAPDPNLSRTLASLEILDASGAILYRKTIPYGVEGGKLRPVVTASAQLLPGDNLTGLLIRYVDQTAAPASGESWQVFGFRNGKLALFERPTGTDPGMGAPFTGVFMRGGTGAQPMVVQADLVELRVWTGNFRVVVPLRVDWRQGRLAPGERCLEAGGGPGLHETGCDLHVEAQRRPATDEFSFVRMFQQPVEFEGGARHVVMKKNAKVEFLKARAIIRWSGVGDTMRAVLSDLWLRVLIDDNSDKDGWIHGEEDFAAAGLPSGNPAP